MRPWRSDGKRQEGAALPRFRLRWRRRGRIRREPRIRRSNLVSVHRLLGRYWKRTPGTRVGRRGRKVAGVPAGSGHLLRRRRQRGSELGEAERVLAHSRRAGHRVRVVLKHAGRRDVDVVRAAVEVLVDRGLVLLLNNLLRFAKPALSKWKCLNINLNFSIKCIQKSEDSETDNIIDFIRRQK